MFDDEGRIIPQGMPRFILGGGQHIGERVSPVAINI